MLFKFSCCHRLMKDFYKYQIYTGPAVVTLVGKLFGQWSDSAFKQHRPDKNSSCGACA